MDLSLSFMGTGASVPSARRNTAATVVSRGGEQLLFDCGEGTQRQLQRSLGLVPVERIFITHYHADHVLGLPGLIKTFDLMEREQPLEVYGPPGLESLFRDLRPFVGGTSFPIRLHEVAHGDRVDMGRREDGRYQVEAFEVRHRRPCLGYAIVEPTRPGRFDPTRAEGLGVRPGPDFGRLQSGEPVEGSSGTVHPEHVMGPERPGRTIVLAGDTAPCMSTLEAAGDAQLLVHEATFVEEEAERAKTTGHSTARQAAALAAEARVEMLALVHISSRYHVGAVLEEARSEFANAVAPRDFDVIEVPYPDHGGARLISGGARRRDDG